MGDEFSEDCLASIGVDKLEMNFMLKNNEDIKLILFDTSGPERFRSITLTVLKHVHGVILVFDVTRKTSFDNLNIWLEEIKNITDKLILVLFANKVDYDKSNWQVSIEEVKQFAEKMQIPLFETSARTKQGIMEGLSYIVNEIYDKKFMKNNESIIINNKERKSNNNSGCITNKKNKKINDDKNKKK